MKHETGHERIIFAMMDALAGNARNEWREKQLISQRLGAENLLSFQFRITLQSGFIYLLLIMIACSLLSF